MQLAVTMFLLAVIMVDVLYLVGVPLALRLLRALLLFLTIPLGIVEEFREQLHHFNRLAGPHDSRSNLRRALASALAALHEATFGVLGIDRVGVGRVSIKSNPHTVRNGLRQHLLWVFRGQPPFEVLVKPRSPTEQVQRLTAVFKGTGAPFAKFNGWALVWCFVSYYIGSAMRSSKPPDAATIRTVFNSFTIVGVCTYCVTMLSPRFQGQALTTRMV